MNALHPYKREMSKTVFKKDLKSFNIGTLVQLPYFPCTLSVNILYIAKNLT